MILTRSPLRLSFLGGGSDLPAFYREEEGAAVSTTIDKYVYTSLKPTFEKGLHLAYAKVEACSTLDEIEHPIFRTALKNFEIDLRGERGLSIVSTADVDYGTGLGGSSSFTVGLLQALMAQTGRQALSASELAMEASRIEIEQLGEPIGRQDHFAAAHGGLMLIRFLPSGEIQVEPIQLSRERAGELERSILLFYTGAQRSASQILASYRERLPLLRESIREMKELALHLKTVLQTEHQNDWIQAIGELLHEGWLVKRAWSREISTNAIDDLYARALKAGGIGGKIVGAGGGGFLMIVAPRERHEAIRAALSELRTLAVKLTHQGSEILLNKSDQVFDHSFKKAETL